MSASTSLPLRPSEVSRIDGAARMNRLMALLLALSGLLLALLLAAVALGAGREAPLAHPEHAPMLVGTDAGRLGAPAWAGYVVGVAVFAIIWVGMRVGIRRGHWVGRLVSAWNVGYILLLLALLASFEAYAAGRLTIALGFTAPVAWLVYGLGLAPWIPLLAITWTFEEAYFGPREEARFRQILAERRAAATPGAGGG